MPNSKHTITNVVSAHAMYSLVCFQLHLMMKVTSKDRLDTSKSDKTDFEKISGKKKPPRIK